MVFPTKIDIVTIFKTSCNTKKKEHYFCNQLFTSNALNCTDCFLARRPVLRGQTQDWLARCQDNVTGWFIRAFCLRHGAARALLCLMQQVATVVIFTLRTQMGERYAKHRACARTYTHTHTHSRFFLKSDGLLGKFSYSETNSETRNE